METEGGVIPLIVILGVGIFSEAAIYIGVCNTAKAEAIAAQNKADMMEAKYNYAVATGDWSVWDD